MPGTKEIRTKIASVKSTQKITKAMEMVAASKMRRAQERMRLARPYADKIRTVIGHLNKANPDYKHPFLVEREAKHIGIIIVSSDRGLCGALNTNVFKSTLGLMRDWQGKDAKVSLCVLGSKGLTFFRRLGLPILASRASSLFSRSSLILSAPASLRYKRFTSSMMCDYSSSSTVSSYLPNSA